MSFNLKNFQNLFIGLNKEDARKKASSLAHKFTQAHPVLVENYDDAMYLRHLFIYLNIDDISKYISHLNSFESKNRLDVYLTDNHLWPSACRILYSNFNPGLVKDILKIDLSSSYASKINSKIFAGVYAYLFKSESPITLNFSLDHLDSVFLQPGLFTDWDQIDIDSKIKIWSVLAGTKNTALLDNVAKSFDWNKQWLIGSEFMIEELLSNVQSERFNAVTKLVKSKEETIYSGIDLNI